MTVNSSLITLRLEYMTNPSGRGDIGAYMEWLELQVLSLRGQLADLQAAQREDEKCSTSQSV